MSFVSSKGNILCRLIKIELYKIFAIINRAIKGSTVYVYTIHKTAHYRNRLLSQASATAWQDPRGWPFRDCMMTSSNGNIFRVTGPLWGEFTGHRWIPLTKASDAGLWYFLGSCRSPLVPRTTPTHEDVCLRSESVSMSMTLVVVGLLTGFSSWKNI